MGIIDRFFRSKRKEDVIDNGPSISELIESAENGDPEAQFELGGAYHNGVGVPQSYADAFKWFKVAAENGIVAARFNIAYMYVNGIGVPQPSDSV